MKGRRLSLASREPARVAVVCLCKDRPEVVEQFVLRQRSLGASELRVYFDDPDDPSLAWAAAQPGVQAIACDDDFWAMVKWKNSTERPRFIESRQVSCYLHAYSTFSSDFWIGFCDVDELFVPHTDFSSILDGLTSDVMQIRAVTAEAIWRPGADPDPLMSATLARRPIWNKNKLKGVLRYRSALYDVLSQKGLVGHPWGKAMVRGGANIVPAIHGHYGFDADGTKSKLPNTKVPITLLHYDAPSYPDWCAKHLRRLSKQTLIGGNPPSRNAQSELFALCTDDTRRRALFDSFYGSSDDLIAALERAGALVRITDRDSGGRTQR